MRSSVPLLAIHLSWLAWTPSWSGCLDLNNRTCERTHSFFPRSFSSLSLCIYISIRHDPSTNQFIQWFLDLSVYCIILYVLYYTHKHVSWTWTTAVYFLTGLRFSLIVHCNSEVLQCWCKAAARCAKAAKVTTLGSVPTSEGWSYQKL